MRNSLFSLALALVLTHTTGCHGDGPAATGEAQLPQKPTTLQATNDMKIRLTVGGTVIVGTLTNSKAAQDFASMLPLTLTMNDLFGREKYAKLPRAISQEGKRTHTYQVGDVAYWSPARDVAIFYRQDGETIPAPGLVFLGKFDSDVKALDVTGSVKVTIELHEEHSERKP